MLAPTETKPRFACTDWWEKIQAGETPMAAVPINEARAAKALAFFNRLRLPDVPGNPPLSEACGDWFRDILVAFLASEDPETKRRLVWELLCMVPKKNSKTTYVAALGLTALFMEEAPNRQMLIVAPSQNISQRCFEQAQGMIRIDARLDAIFKITDNLKSISRRKTGTDLQVKTFDTSIVTGEIPILTIIDELHELRHRLFIRLRLPDQSADDAKDIANAMIELGDEKLLTRACLMAFRGRLVCETQNDLDERRA